MSLSEIFSRNICTEHFQALAVLEGYEDRFAVFVAKYQVAALLAFEGDLAEHLACRIEYIDRALSPAANIQVAVLVAMHAIQSVIGESGEKLLV